MVVELRGIPHCFGAGKSLQRLGEISYWAAAFGSLREFDHELSPRHAVGTGELICEAAVRRDQGCRSAKLARRLLYRCRRHCVVCDMDPLSIHQNSEGGDPERSKATGNLLIVEPEELVRWSLVTYLSRSFSIFTADSKDAAIRVLSEQDIDAVVITDDMADPVGAQIESLARKRNADVRVIWMLSNPRAAKTFPPGTLAVDKPFELEHLAGLLQGNNQAVGGDTEENSCSPKTT